MSDLEATLGSDLSATLLGFREEMGELNGIDAILDRILGHARGFSYADAGSIFLKEGDNLRFGYVHNDTLFEPGATSEAQYADYTVPIDSSSIVGHVARTGGDLVVDNAYALPDGLPYRFNPKYDAEAGYRTISMLTVPLRSGQGRLVGVMQLLNARDPEGRAVPFSERAHRYATLLARDAAIAIERGIMNRQSALRMMRMAQMRDPAETGAHVQRVGAYAAEIYKKWVVRHPERPQSVPSMAPPPAMADPRAYIARKADRLQLAAMLHDVGKVGVPDAVLKKPGRLDPEQFEIMKLHTVDGARLFANIESELDQMCFDISLHHHEKWDGSGYPGLCGDVTCQVHLPGRSLSGQNIPLSARIAALADVYDALVSRRVYKDAWPEDKVLDLVREQSGKHFDPELVEVFFEIHPLILAIRERYTG